MSWLRRTPERHGPDWRRLWRYCRCGEPWGCRDQRRPATPALPPVATVRGRARPVNHGHFRAWNAPTAISDGAR
ncbi:hypothetical protein [Plantactinospora sp. CA-290183]|uniref:hypothetical protein n=1 Tax=Plantactinospora sp. CA-290183 TaxID=3240006 RepID=UPI003D8C1D2B